MDKVLVFCSNPVNGGTAEMFAEMCREVALQGAGEFEIIPCCNKGNDVKVYQTLPGLVMLDVLSEEQMLGLVKTDVSFSERFWNRLIRNKRYALQKEKNLSVLREFLAEQGVHAVVIHNGGYVGDDLCNQMLQAAADVGVKKRIMVFHNDFQKSYLQKLRYRNYDHMINRCATKTVTVSEYTRNRILQNSYLRQDMQVLYNGLTFENKETYEQRAEKISYQPDVFCIGMVGNFMRNKGQAEMLHAVYLAQQQCNQQLQIILIGNVYEDAYFNACKERIAEYELDDIVSIYHGIYNAREYYELFDVTIVPSLYDESFGLITVESMRAATPVVAFACGGVQEVIADGEDGFLVPVGDCKRMADKIVALIEDPELLHAMGERAKENYENKFTRSTMGERYLKLLRT